MLINLKRLTPKQLDDLARQIEAHKSERPLVSHCGRAREG
jgi:hypothetical protein